MKYFILITFLVFNCKTMAAFQNPNSILPGDRASGMGGASAAVIGDISSSAYYNPALLSMAQGSSFSAAVGVYKKFDTLYGDTADYLRTPLRINTGFFRSLPASTGNVVEWQDWKLGMSIIVPDYEHFKGDLANSNTQTSTLTYTDESLWVGGAASKRLDENRSIGITLYYSARNYVRSIQDKTYDGTDSRIYTSDTTITQNAIVPILGYYQRFTPSLAAGLSLRLQGIPFSSTAAYFEDEVDTANSSNNKKVNETDLHADNFIPLQIRAGASWKIDESWCLAADITYQNGRKFKLFGLDGKSDILDYRETYNASFGLEKKFLENLHGRIGAFTNLSAHPDPNSSLGYLQGETVNQAGFSANLHFISGSKIGYTFGGYYTGGRGHAVIRSAHQFVETAKTTNVFTMLVGTSFYF